MKKEAITVQMDAEKLRAVKRYMEKKDADLEQELCDQLQRLYEKFVPANVREYIDESADIETPASTLSKKQKEKIRQTAEPRQADEQ
ncbi:MULTISPECIES: DUF6103 family protein [Clostridia]|jgi:hypothetical protein|uniref:Uncharacterized protein n=4 Tax=root TaxID=1 RepID=A0A8J8AZW8_9FIRM|nr:MULTISPECIES: DUF6103 family protein [Clostridia]ADY54414.1 hypothetical protein Sgly_0039 [Syntrophobotulus glycolicus DSM 8271]MBR0596257.1 hypothetical protein [Sinanaerobacter chloroacetimidivorans]QEY35018.1 hypothetical protein FL966_08150 [Caproiciproducens galactitolivorans]TGJ76770.1 hypothetical protein CAGA_13150 [Caproiciproducens galactitolivorans]